jgi:hypothetical protein
MTKIAGSGSESGSISQRHGSGDPYPDTVPHQNVMDPEHWQEIKRKAREKTLMSNEHTLSASRLTELR